MRNTKRRSNVYLHTWLTLTLSTDADIGRYQHPDILRAGACHVFLSYTRDLVRDRKNMFPRLKLDLSRGAGLGISVVQYCSTLLSQRGALETTEDLAVSTHNSTRLVQTLPTGLAERRDEEM